MKKNKEASGMMLVGILVIMLPNYLFETVDYPIIAISLGLLAILLCLINFSVGKKGILNICLFLGIAMPIIILVTKF